MSIFRHANRVDLWHIHLDDDYWDTHAHVLSTDEYARALRMRNSDAQRQFRRARSALRVILATYTGMAPAALPVVTGAAGKPYLTGRALHFNLSHSCEVAMLAVAACSVGVDIEVETAADDVTDRMQQIVLHPRERKLLSASSAISRKRDFLRLWVRKEAIVKVSGMGLRYPLASVDCTDAPRVRGIDDHGRHLFVHDVPAPIGYLASLCYSRAFPRVWRTRASPSTPAAQSRFVPISQRNCATISVRSS